MSTAERAELAREIAQAVSGKDTARACACNGHASATAHPVAPVHGLAGALDLSLQRPDATRAEVERFLQAARAADLRSVCVQPKWAALAVRKLAGNRCMVASYVAYPHGATLTPAKCAEAELLLRLGVHELWMVADIAALRGGDLDAAFIDIRAVARIVECRHARLTVILELPLLSEQQGIKACVVAKLAGATAVASASGACPKPTQPRHLALMRRTLGEEGELVASGGVETAAAAQALLAAGATRIESSSQPLR